MSETIRVVVVDDEHLARERLRTLYGSEQQVLLREYDNAGTEVIVELPWKAAVSREPHAARAR